MEYVSKVFTTIAESATIESVKSSLLSLSTITLLTSTLAALAGLAVIRAITKKKLRLPPGPNGWPVIGQAGILSHDDLEEDLKRLTAEYGDIIYLPIPFAPVVALTSYKVIKEAYANKGQQFSHRPKMQIVRLMDFYDEIFAPPATEKWRMDKSFAISNLKQFTSKRGGGEEIILREFDKVNETIGASARHTFDCILTIQRATANVIHGVMFGEMFEYGDTKLDHFKKLILDWYRAFSSFTQVVTWMPDFLVKVIYKEDSKALYDLTRNFETYIRDKVSAHRETYDTDNMRDITDIYLKHRGNLPEEDWKEVYHTILVYMPDAVESISSVINFSVLYAGSFPEFQKEVQDEIKEVMGSALYVKLQHKPNLPKTEAFCLEVMRTVVVSGTLPHCCHEDTELCGYDIPKNTPIIASLYLAMHDPKVYPKPYTFNPHRFLGEDGFVKKDLSWIPFGIGKRSCPGEDLAKLEIFIMVANIFKRYKITFPAHQSNPDLEPVPLLIRYPKPFKCIFTPLH